MRTPTGTERHCAPGAVGSTAKAIVVSMPLPLVLLSLNKRLFWRERARHTKEQRAWAMLAAYEALSRERGTLRGVFFPEGRVTVDLVVYRRPRQKQMDDGGLIEAAKSWVDGCEDAGIVADDKQCRIGAVRWEPSNAAPRIELTFRQEV